MARLDACPSPFDSRNEKQTFGVDELVLELYVLFNIAAPAAPADEVSSPPSLGRLIKQDYEKKKYYLGSPGVACSDNARLMLYRAECHGRQESETRGDPSAGP